MQKTNAQIVEKYYENWTEAYLEDFGLVFQALQTKDPKALFKYILKLNGINKNARILDAGCGVGGPAHLLAKLQKVQIEGLTLSQSQVSYWEEHLKNERRKGTVNIQKGDFHQLSNYYPEDSFDYVLFQESLCHSDNPDQVLKEVHKVLKPNGVLYIKDLYRGPEDPSGSFDINEPIKAIEEQFHLKIRPVGEIVDLLGKNGFEVEVCQIPQIDRFFDRGNQFTARHLIKLFQNQKGPWVDRGIVFLNWLEIRARLHY